VIGSGLVDRRSRGLSGSFVGSRALFGGGFSSTIFPRVVVFLGETTGSVLTLSVAGLVLNSR